MRCVEIALCTRAARLDDLPERRFRTDIDQSYEPWVWLHAERCLFGRLIADVWDRSRLHTKALSATSRLYSWEPLLARRRGLDEARTLAFGNVCDMMT